MTEPLMEWAALAVSECRLLDIPERAATVDVNPIVQVFGKEPETLELNRNINAKNPWYLQVLKEASHILHWPHDHGGHLFSISFL